MMTLGDFMKITIEELLKENLPVNVVIGDKYYDIESLYFDKETNEYMLKLNQGLNYQNRGDLYEKSKTI